MFDHLGIVATNLANSRTFYCACLEQLGITLLEDHSDTGTGWLVFGTGPSDAFFVVAGGPPSFWRDTDVAGRGPSHIAFVAPDHAAVDAFHRAGLEHGGTDNGTPGLRPSDTRYYAAYLIDPDGNNIEAGHRSKS